MTRNNKAMILFITFLNEQGITAKYLNELKEHTGLLTITAMQDFLKEDDQPQYDFIAYGFQWDDGGYWKRMNDKWLMYYGKHS